MSELSHAIAQNIASRDREKSLVERGFMALNALADGIGVGRRALARLAVMMADGVGAVRTRAMKAAPGVGAGVLAGLNSTREEQEEAEKPIPAAVRRRWTAALKKLGKPQVSEYLDRTAHMSVTAPFLLADTGLMHGATRYPSRGFAFDWVSGASKGDGGAGVLLAICAICAMAGAWVLVWMLL